MTQIKDVMSSEYKFVSPETTVQETAEIMRAYDIGFIPVGENDRLIGMVTDRDIVTRSAADGRRPYEHCVGEIMTPKTYYCFDDQSIDEVCDNMAEIKVRRLPVVNRDKRLVGIVSLGDVAQRTHRAKAGDALQEITCHTNVAKAA